MKITVMLLFVGGAIGISAGYAQHTATPERKFYYLNKAEEDIFELPFTKDSILNFIHPEIMDERAILAPNFPIYAPNAKLEAKKMAFFVWLETHPDEFDLYYAYVVTYIRTNQFH